MLIKAGATPEFTIDIRNVGLTPAREVVVRLKVTVADFPLLSPLADECIDQHTSRMVLFPKDRFNYTGKMNEPLTKQDVAAINQEDASRRLCIQGRIDYVDAFGYEHWTTLLVLSTYINGSPGFTNASHGNDYS